MIKICLMALFFMIFAPITWAEYDNSSSLGAPAFLPDCSGLLPDNYEYIDFIRKVGESFALDNTKEGDKYAKKIFYLLGLRNSSYLEAQDDITENTKKDIDKAIGDSLCKGLGKVSPKDLWSGSPQVKAWVKDNINDLTKQVESILTFTIKLRTQIELTEKQKKRSLKKINELEETSDAKAEETIKKLKKKGK